MKEKFKVLVDLTMLKFKYTGFYQFSLSLGLAMQEVAQEDKYNELQLTYLVPNNFDLGLFSNVNIIKENRLTKHSPISIKNLLFKKYNLIHATTQNSRYIVSKLPLIYTIHDLNFLIDEDGDTRKKKVNKMQFAINQSKYITAISNYTKKQIKENLKVSVPIEVIYNGMDLRIGTNTTKIDYVNEKIPFLFTIGTIHEKKNFHVLIDFLNLLPNYQLFIAGNKSTAYANFIQSRINELNLNHRVKLLGEISDENRNWFYQNCKAFVFPSKLEGFGLPIIEAMSLGKPVFLSTYSCLPEVGGDEAYYFKNFEPESMKEKFLQSMANFESDTFKKESIIKHASQFSWEKASRQYLNLYKKILLKK